MLPSEGHDLEIPEGIEDWCEEQKALIEELGQEHEGRPENRAAEPFYVESFDLDEYLEDLDV